MQPPVLQTSRLVIEPLDDRDAPAMFAYRSDPSVTRFQTWRPCGVEEVLELIRRTNRTPFGRTGSWFQLGIRLKGSRELVGDVGLHFLPPDDRQAEIGFTVGPAHQRRGYGAEAVRAVVGFLLGTQGRHRITASVDPGNAASRALLRRVGFRQEAHFRESLWADGAWQDDVIYAMLQEDWNAAEGDRR